MRVCVLGAGITGLAAAYQLQREGHQVTVIDQAQAGAGASGANGAQLSYAYVQPLADPAIWRQLPRLLLAADSPFELRLQWDVRQWLWGLQFLAACRGAVSRRSTAQLLALAAQSRAGFEQLLVQERLACDFSATGKLVLYRDEASFAAARRQLALQQSLGSEQSAVSAAECVAIEPALGHYRGRISGAIHTPGECAADCHMVCQELQRIIESRGARLLLGTAVADLVVRRGTAVAAQTRHGGVEADAFVVALGAASQHLARKLGLYLPVYPLKGYSITLPAAPGCAAAPRVNVTDAARKVVFARVGQRLRVAGLAELAGESMEIPSRRIDALLRAAREIFPQGGAFEQARPWAGLRPATPTGLPIIGPHPRGPANVLFNTGHGALGFTLAFGSAQRLARLLRPPPGRAFTPAAQGPASCSA
jgi:D-amino-acid dehydrogenase